MLTEDQNRVLTQVGPGEPMGELLRRYWLPIAGASEFDARSVKPVRLLCEDLVLYKDTNGGFGLVDRRCPHRRADLAYGFVDGPGLRCNYHGWLIGSDGSCLAQPFDDVVYPQANLKSGVRTKAYPVRELAGLLWTYMGPNPAPALPVWEPFTWKNGFVEVVLSDVPCNWFQCQENSCDPVHFEWMHDNWSAYLRGEGAASAKHLKLAFEEFEYGFTYKRVREGQAESDPMWTTGRVALWPIGFYLGQHFEWRVPVDNENTLSITWFYARVPKGREPYVQKRAPTWVSPIRDAAGEWIKSHIMNQDILAWVGQGVIADRSKEFLSASDRGIVMMRRRYFEEIARMKSGQDPKGVIRDETLARCVPLPVAERVNLVEGVPLEQWGSHRLLKLRMQGFPWSYGQPDEVWSEYAAAMGLDDSMRTNP